MFELSVACKYLIPRRRQLSVSIISIVSILVISLVVWLIVVFFSVTDGLEKGWIHKLTALTAPVRITPTDAYFNSYYYQIDSIAEASGYTHKTISEKKTSEKSDPYDSSSDEEIPSAWPVPDRDASGDTKDIVKLTYASINEIKGIPDLKAQDFELTGSQIRLQLLRESNAAPLSPTITQSYLTYPSYLGNFEPENANLRQTILSLTIKDINNLFSLMATESDFSQEEENQKIKFFPPPILQHRLKEFFQHVHITQLMTRVSGWTIPRSLIPSQTAWESLAIFRGSTLIKILVPQQIKDISKWKKEFEEDPALTIVNGTIREEKEDLLFESPERRTIALSNRIGLYLIGGIKFPAQLVEKSIDQAKRLSDLKFNIQTSIQGTPIQGSIPYRELEIVAADFPKQVQAEAKSFPLWVHRLIHKDSSATYTLPIDPELGEGVLLPKGFKETGVLVGDRGYLSYVSPTASMIQEQHLPVYVAGFYDPGIIPIGGKFILVNRDVISIIRAAHQGDERVATNGINVRFKDFQKADLVKAHILQAFQDKGISRYWNVETYKEFDFTKEIIRELHSQKNIFMLIAIVIILVACSNIISMLIILVNDKKVEIGILRSMGATSKSIALIFGLSGAAIGIIGSVIGIAAAVLTVNNLQSLISLISRLQGYDLLNAAFYGENIPQELSLEALSFVIIATMLISLLAGIVPAIKACLLKPTAILRATG